jgi:hypothetical protein
LDSFAIDKYHAGRGSIWLNLPMLNQMIVTRNLLLVTAKKLTRNIEKKKNLKKNLRHWQTDIYIGIKCYSMTPPHDEKVRLDLSEGDIAEIISLLQNELSYAKDEEEALKYFRILRKIAYQETNRRIKSLDTEEKKRLR